MNTTTMANYRPFQKLHPLTLLAQFSSRQADGCLQVSNGSTVWALYLEQGKLIYATNTSNPFERLDRHLRHLSHQVPSLVSAVRVQVRLLFDRGDNNFSDLSDDYKAICWLVDQQHLSAHQAGQLVEGLAKEVIESFLPLQEGSHELIPLDHLGRLPQFCQVDLRELVEQSQSPSQPQPRQIAPLIPPLIPKASGLERLTLHQNGATPPTALNPTSMDNPAEETAQTSFSSMDAPTQFKRNQANSLPIPFPANKTTYTIACIDDSLTVLQAIRSFLDDKMFTVLMIDNPVKALMQIIRSKPDLILLDVSMPNLDGYELCSLLRKHPSFKHTPVVMVTGNTGLIDRAKAKIVGASGYLTKPFTQSDLVKMVFKHLV